MYYQLSIVKTIDLESKPNKILSDMVLTNTTCCNFPSLSGMIHLWSSLVKMKKVLEIILANALNLDNRMRTALGL